MATVGAKGLRGLNNWCYTGYAHWTATWTASALAVKSHSL